MDSDAFRTSADRLKEINEVITQLDESIRPAAFDVLRPYVDGRASPARERDDRQGVSNGDNNVAIANDLLVDRDIVREFLGEHHSEKPAENVKAIAGLVYSRYGTSEFTAQEVREVAHEAGVTVPDRVDVTLGTARVNKKPLFQKVRPGVYRPTVHGEKFFKETFKVTKGTGRRPEQGS